MAEVKTHTAQNSQKLSIYERLTYHNTDTTILAQHPLYNLITIKYFTSTNYAILQ